MKKQKWIALLLAAVLLLSGCNLAEFENFMGDLGAQVATPFSEMKYTRPDMEQMKLSAQKCCESAQVQTDAGALLDQVWEFYALYNSFYTNCNLANIYYFKDMSSSYWEEEYSYCMQNASVAEASWEEVMYALAACPLKGELEKDPAFGEGFFDSYVGQTLWDETFTRLMDEEAALEEQYYELSAKAQDYGYYSDAFFESCGNELAQVYVELVSVRQEIAEYAGYENYPQFAYDFYHYRDYTPSQVEAYIEQIQQELVPLYREMESGVIEVTNGLCNERELFSFVENCAQSMGGAIRNAFVLMKQAGLYDITYSDKKYDGSFEVYLQDYAVPYIFVKPYATQQDKLSFAHEFGHFCNDYACGGAYVGIDVAEVFSQAMEYLCLCYGGDENLQKLKMADSLRIYVEQAAYAKFEQQVYLLEGEELTVENVQGLYEKIGKEFGFDAWDWDSRDFVLIGHFFTDPLYIISYVVSNDAAMQIYQMEQSNSGEGLALFERELTTTKLYFLEFLTEAGLQSPFAQGRVKSVRQTFESVL